MSIVEEYLLCSSLHRAACFPRIECVEFTACVDYNKFGAFFEGLTKAVK